MKGGLFVWLPSPISLESNRPKELLSWAEQHGCTVVNYVDLQASLAKAKFLVTACCAEQMDWLPLLFQEVPIPIWVYGPCSKAHRVFVHGVLRSEHEFDLPSEFSCPMPSSPHEHPAGDFFSTARATGWSPELEVLTPVLRPPKRDTAWIAVEGADGAGKSTQASLLKQGLPMTSEPRVLRSCRSGSFYREVSELLQASVLQNDARGWRWGRLWKIFDSLRGTWAQVESHGDETLVWDRYMDTHLAASSMRFGDDSGLGALIDSAPTCAQQVYLDLPERVSAQRRTKRVEVPTLDEHQWSQQRYRLAFRAQARSGRMHLVDANASVLEVQQRVRCALGLPEVMGQENVVATTVKPPTWPSFPACKEIRLDASSAPDTFPPSPDLDPGMDWSGFLLAMEMAGDTLRLRDRIDLLCLELMRRAKAGIPSFDFPLWPPLLRAVHGLSPSYEPTDLPQNLQWIDSKTIHPQWKPFFASEAAVLEYRHRASQNRSELEVAGVLCRNAQQELFLELRHPVKKLYPSCWDSPGGKLEPMEYPVRAAQREMQEEYGIHAPLKAYQHLLTTDDIEPTTGLPIRHHIFILDDSSWTLSLGPDAIDTAWISRSDALALPNLARPLRAALSKLSASSSSACCSSTHE